MALGLALWDPPSWPGWGWRRAEWRHGFLAGGGTLAAATTGCFLFPSNGGAWLWLSAGLRWPSQAFLAGPGPR